jgi:hypothetical protein
MNARATFLVLFFAAFAVPVSAQKLMLAHVAVNPSQGMLHLAKDSGILAKYGFNAEVLLIPGTPRPIVPSVPESDEGAPLLATNYSIRKARPEDIDAVVEIEELAFPPAKYAGMTMSRRPFGGHIAQGRQIAQLGHVPSVDTLSFWRSAPQPWNNYEWASDLLAFWLYAGFGPNALIALKCAALALAAGLLGWLAFRLGGPRAAMACAVLLVAAIPAARFRFSERPQVVAMLRRDRQAVPAARAGAELPHQLR